MRSARRARWGTTFVAAIAASVLTLGGSAVANPGVPEIGPGSDNEAGVRCVQQAHNTVSGAGLAVDGQYGPATTAGDPEFPAVRRAWPTTARSARGPAARSATSTT